jgi:aspartyl-tRNA(Asn)/glutamyl-tRNA(Gln) amidotransferase subunit C
LGNAFSKCACAGPFLPFELCPLPFSLSPMAATDLDVKYVAHLARIALSPEEEQKIGAQLGNILEYIEKLKKLDVTDVQPTAHAVPLINVMRPDETRPSLSNDEALQNAPATANGLFLVPKIVE